MSSLTFGCLRHSAASLVLTGLVAGCGAMQAGPATPAAVEQEPLMTVTILGSGTPVPNRDQAGAAILVEVAGEVLLFDCGRGCTTRLAAYDPALLTDIDTVFLTHLHSDHVVGLPDLWLNGWTQGRDASLCVWGPEGTTGLFSGLEDAYAADIALRTAPKGPKAPGSLIADVRTLPEAGGQVYAENGLTVTAFPVSHAGMPAFGYRIDYAGRSVLVSGDTTVTPTLAQYGRAADLLLLEVASPAMVDYVRSAFPAPQAEAIIGLHLTAEQAASVMAAIRPGLAVYYHTVASCETDPALLERTRETYDGDVLVARDLMQITLGNDGTSMQWRGDDPRDCGRE